jgi:hypothetical protein
MTDRFVMSALVIAASKNVTPYSSTPTLVTVRDPSNGAPHLLTVNAWPTTNVLS